MRVFRVYDCHRQWFVWVVKCLLRLICLVAFVKVAVMLRSLFDLHQMSIIHGLSQVQLQLAFRQNVFRSVALVLEKSLFGCVSKKIRRILLKNYHSVIGCRVKDNSDQYANVCPFCECVQEIQINQQIILESKFHQRNNEW